MLFLSVIFLIYILWGWVLAPMISLYLLQKMLQNRQLIDADVCVRVNFVLNRYYQENVTALINAVKNTSSGSEDAYFIVNRLRQCLNLMSTWE